MDFVKFAAPAHPALDALRSAINSEAVIGNVPPCALAAICMRETGGRNVFQDGMAKGAGCGCGLTQITADVDWTDINDPRFQGYRLMDEQQNLYVAAAFFLSPAIKQCLMLREQYGDTMAKFSDEILYFAFAAYNAGFGAVKSAIVNGQDPDLKTTNKYASGTLAYYTEFLKSSHAIEDARTAVPAAAPAGNGAAVGAAAGGG